jgi:hypothetical protein
MGNKTYICFDGDTDMAQYRLMTAWHANKKMSFEFQNAHDLNTARDSSQEESIKRQLRVRFANSKDFIVLIGEKTKNLTKFVRWEMEVALNLGLPIIGVNLNGSRSQDERCPAIIRNELVVYVNFSPKIIEHALNNWPTECATLKKSGTTGSRFYNDSVYTSLGIPK